MFRRLSVLVAIVTLAMFSPGTHEALAQQDQAIKRIKSEGVLRVGIADSAPFAIKNPATNAWEGFNVDMANDLAQSLGVKLQMVDASWATIINGLLSNQYDVLMASTYASPERAQSVVFTTTYITSGELILVHRDSPYQKHEDLNQANVTFSVLGGTTNERTARARFPNAKVRVLTTDNQVAPVLEVANKRAEANVADSNSARRFIRTNPEAPVRLLEPDREINQARRAYSVRPGEYHLLNFLNNWLEAQHLSGRISALRAKWELN
ncbi:transporter substrate-binding domain-containing protein [Microvirga massiliensis]|uniref:transporter substrate-binding domain-containing protein n=1 Tax=Microvirga massiliensis TaxID=1033741 RepID=UPI00062BE115|nr:transporter substrate-binding domain-containing protein [Microvirga massiliensis]